LLWRRFFSSSISSLSNDCRLIKHQKEGIITELSEYAKYDGLGLAELVRKGEVSPKELMETALKAIEHLNPTLNSVIT
jgi:hypothetical protein